MSLLSQKHLQDEEAAYAWVEARIWPKGAQCPHCFEKARVSKMQGKATRFGLYKCYACRKQFRVTVGTIFEKSHVPLHLWLQAFYLIAGSKKGISANQLHRTLGVTLKTAWFMGHRIREAMQADWREELRAALASGKSLAVARSVTLGMPHAFGRALCLDSASDLARGMRTSRRPATGELSCHLERLVDCRLGERGPDLSTMARLATTTER